MVGVVELKKTGDFLYCGYCVTVHKGVLLLLFEYFLHVGVAA